jgi:predicted Rossmann fold nucleotide-binding protein DprA/Smf involved in DNA uptake
MEYWGNIDILKLNKTAFLCSQRVPAQAVLNSYDWAKEQRKRGNCIVCGNHSQIEKDVFEILLNGKQPLILVLARGMQKQWPAEIKNAIEKERLLVCSPFASNVTRITREKAEIRNKAIIDMSDNIVVGFITVGGQLNILLNEIKYISL